MENNGAHDRTGPMRTILLYSAGHLGSATILNRLLDSKEFEIVGMVKATSIPFSLKGVRSLKRHLKKVGWRFGWLLFWQQVIQALVFLLTLLWPHRSRRLKPGWKLARERGIPIYFCKNINEKPCIDFMNSLSPDLVVSAYFNQILKKKAIRVPAMGVLNVHPGWLPAYRGAMCYFWILKNGEETGGVTVHWIDEGIDTGEIVARRSFRLKPGWTQQRVLVLTAVIGSRLLRRIGKKLARGKRLNPPENRAKEGASYYPMPTDADFEDYFAERRYFRIRDIFGFLFGRGGDRKRPL